MVLDRLLRREPVSKLEAFTRNTLERLHMAYRFIDCPWCHERTFLYLRGVSLILPIEGDVAKSYGGLSTMLPSLASGSGSVCVHCRQTIEAWYDNWTRLEAWDDGTEDTYRYEDLPSSRMGHANGSKQTVTIERCLSTLEIPIIDSQSNLVGHFPPEFAERLGWHSHRYPWYRRTKDVADLMWTFLPDQLRPLVK